MTNERYAACVADSACQPTDDNSSYTRHSYYGNPQYEDYPMIRVTWDDAVAYAEWAGGRLPTEAEWEYAARGPEGRVYPWGDVFDGERLNFCDLNCPLDHAGRTIDDGYADTAPVGAYPASARWVGALDMSGNVWEWVSDWYDDTYYQNSTAINPLGPNSGTYKSVRGGAWSDYDRFTRAAFRYHFDPYDRNYYVGFRVVEPVSDPGS